MTDPHNVTCTWSMTEDERNALKPHKFTPKRMVRKRGDNGLGKKKPKAIHNYFKGPTLDEYTVRLPKHRQGHGD